MKRDYRRWYSPRLHRDMELLIFGHAGAKVLMFPTRDGRFWEYEKLNVVASLADKVGAGQLQLYCIEGLAQETFYDAGRHPADRIRRHAAFEDYILNEVLPREDLLPRALDLAAQIMDRPRTARRLTHGLLTRTWQRSLITGLRDSYAHQLLAMTATPGNDERPRNA